MLNRLLECNKICLHGLHQSERSSYHKLNNVLLILGAKPSSSDLCLYRLNQEEKLAVIEISVNDILITIKKSNIMNHSMKDFPNTLTKRP